MTKNIIITIGRQFGCGGKRIAEVLGSKLGIPVYDSELIIKAAQESSFSVEFFERSDEKKRFFSLTSIFAGVAGEDTENFMSDKGLFKIQCETIQRIADQGSAIIVGRCSDYVLRDRKDILNVFLTSPLEERVKRIAETEGVTLEKAEDIVEKQDRNRADYYNYYTFGNWGVASNYDLCIDSSIAGIEGTANMIIEFAKTAGLL